MYKGIFFVVLLSIFSLPVQARRDFYVAKEVRCGVGDMCYEMASGAPLSGKLRLYHMTGVVSEESEYKNGVRDGVKSVFYVSGNQYSYEVYKEGKVHGGMTTYYDSGNVICEVSYNMGVLDGIRRCYYEDGQIKSEENFVNGSKDGKFRQYSPTRDVTDEIIWSMGKVVLARCKQANGRWIDYTSSSDEYLERGLTPCK